MDINKAKTLAKSLMFKHGLIKYEDRVIFSDWMFKFNNRFTTCLGRCSYANQLIELGTKYVEVNTEEKVTRTILHEISHCLAGQNNGHNKKWRDICLSIGGDGKAKSSDHEYIETKNRKKSCIEKYIEVKGVSVIKGKEIELIDGTKCTFEFYNNNNRIYKFHVKVGDTIYKVSEDQIKFK